MMISYSELLKVRGHQGLSEPEVQAILKTVLMQLVTLHCQGKAHQQISLQTLQQDGEQAVLLPKDKPNLKGSPSQDIYDLGLVVLELLTGKVPSPLRANPTWDWNNHCLISDQLNAILKRMVTPNPSQRLKNASEVLSVMGVVVPATRRTLKGWQWGLVGAGTTLAVVMGGLGIGSLFIPALRPLLPSAISSSRSTQEGAAMFRGNLERTGVYPPGGPIELTQLVWKFRTEGGISSSPVVSGRVIYFGSVDNYLYAVDVDSGQERWKFKTESGIGSSPAVSGGVVYFGSGDMNLYAVDANTQQQRWRFETEGGIGSSPAVSGGVVYFGVPYGGPLYAVDTNTGQELWKFKTEGISSSPAVSGGVVYFGSWDGDIYALDANSGQERWKFKTETNINSSPAVSGGVVYFGSQDNHLYAVDVNTGQERWKFRTESGIDSSPAVSGEVVYFGSWDNHLYAVDVNTGQELWKFKTESGIASSPAVSGEVVYFGSSDNHLYAVDVNTGQELWKFRTGGKIFSSPVVSGGVVYFGSDDGYLYAVK